MDRQCYHQESYDSDQLDEDTLVEIMTRSAKLHRRIKRDGAQTDDDERELVCKKLKTLTATGIARPSSAIGQTIDVQAPGEAQLAVGSSGDDDGGADDDQGDEDEDEDEKNDEDTSEGHEIDNEFDSGNVSEDNDDDESSNGVNEDTSDDISYDVQKCSHRFPGKGSPQRTRLDRKRATAMWMLENGHERSLLVRFHPLHCSWGTAEFEKQSKSWPSRTSSKL
jgi:hypothetical protein